jgi:hypothetical protein
LRPGACFWEPVSIGFLDCDGHVRAGIFWHGITLVVRYLG